ncbi:MAG: sulfatase-like hydrolase/transferase [Rhodoferax sp.]|jgi:choline-sulfatase|nr:sulfatase-like hydrolase/transferase [Rhodoferax sp.]
MHQPNILLIFSDQHAQRVAGCYGDRIAETSHLDSLAARGVTFDNAYCPSPICVPSRMSMLTGRHPVDQKCWTLQDYLPSDYPTWPHALGTAGYRPTLISRLHSIGPDQLRGYAERRLGDIGPNWMGVKRQDLGVLSNAQGPSPLSLRNSGPGQSGYQLADIASTEAACAYLREVAADVASGHSVPFCVTVGLVLPHCPFVAWREDYDRFVGRVGMPAVPRADPDREHPWIRWWIEDRGIANPDPDAVMRARTAYYGLVRRMDLMVGQVLDTLKSTGLEDDTLVIYCSDHGEHLGERGLWWKNTLYDEATKVPLIMSWPGHLPRGERRAQLVNLIDVGATIIDAAKAPVLPRSSGHSLLDIARSAQAPWIDETYSEYVTDIVPHWTGNRSTQQRMVRSGDWKLHYIHEEPSLLFNLAQDPLELDNLANDPRYRAIREHLHAKVLQGWDPDAIRKETEIRRREKDLLSQWGAATQPASTYHFPIEAKDSWLD